MQSIHEESDSPMSGRKCDEAMRPHDADAIENLRTFLRILHEWEDESRSERARRLVESVGAEE